MDQPLFTCPPILHIESDVQFRRKTASIQNRKSNGDFEDMIFDIYYMSLADSLKLLYIGEKTKYPDGVTPSPLAQAAR